MLAPKSTVMCSIKVISKKLPKAGLLPSTNCLQTCILLYKYVLTITINDKQN